jgi:hypothetical protein
LAALAGLTPPVWAIDVVAKPTMLKMNKNANFFIGKDGKIVLVKVVY